MREVKLVFFFNRFAFRVALFDAVEKIGSEMFRFGSSLRKFDSLKLGKVAMVFRQHMQTAQTGLSLFGDGNLFFFLHFCRLS